MVVDGDTLYFRVDVAGNGVKPKGMNDTVRINYDLYTRGGKLIESHAKREQDLSKALEEAKADVVDTAVVKDMNAVMRVTQLTQQLENLRNMRMPVSKSLLKGMQYAIQNVGEGGEIILYIPSNLAYGRWGQQRGGIGPNQCLEFRVEVVEVIPTPEEELKKIEEAKKEEAKK
jgi:FKBP-type peptidyl-prolyl cis-trans isomerase 2